jgi:hypothetical protein
MTDFNIVDLIEKNPISKLSSTYNSKLISKIQSNFSGYEQQLFVTSFYCYLNYDKSNDFVVDLDEIWEWLGFSQKIRAKETIERNFKLDIDFKSAFSEKKAENNVKKNGGQNIKKIFLTIKCFKSLCLKAQTKKASEIHEYYIKLEDILHEVLEEESNELKQQLLKKENIILEKEKEVEKAIIKQFPLNTECIYFGTIDNTNELKEKLIKFGHTNDLSTRVLDHHKKYTNFQLVSAFRVQNKVEIENLIKIHSKIKKQIRTIQVNEKNKTEIIAYNETSFTIENLNYYIKEIINSKSYSIDNFNKLLKQNEELMNENDELKNQLRNNNETILKQTLEINELKDKFEKQKQVLDIIESENQSVYQNPLIPENEYTNKFNEFIDKMCIVRSDVEESSVNMEGLYRIWSKVKPKKEIFHALKTYLDIRFKPSRLSNQNKDQLVHGYIGVKLKSIDYKKKCVNNDVETFLFQVCKFSPSGKILNSTLVDEYQRWKKSLNKDCLNREFDMKELKDYLNSCEYVLKATVWSDKGSNEGYYGISLKIDEYKHKTTSSTGKKVEKIEVNTGLILGTWETIAKAAEAENISAAKMSRSLKNKIIYNNDYYYITKIT